MRSLLILASLAVVGGCFPLGPQPCTDLFAFGLSVTVTDAATDDVVCDAVVTVRDGTYEETLVVQGQGAGCVYTGAGERAGTYDIEATKAGFVTATATDVVVGEDECHVIGEAVALSLEAETE